MYGETATTLWIFFIPKRHAEVDEEAWGEGPRESAAIIFRVVVSGAEYDAFHNQ